MARLALVVLRIRLNGLEELPVGRVGGVIRENVEDEPLLDRLTHGVEVEGLETPLGETGAEKLQSLGLGRSRERERGHVG